MSRAKKREAEKEIFLQGIGSPSKEKFVVDDFQKEAIDAIAANQDTLVVAPTGAGKTYIAFEAISIALSVGSRGVYTTPLKALSNAKYSELKKAFEPEKSVGLLTGDRKIDTSSDVVVSTTEIYRNELYSGEGRYGVVVLDEVHYISDSQRGSVWEESIILSPKDSTLLMLSASISNAEEIASWVEHVRSKPCRIVVKEKRPVELRFGFLHPSIGPVPIETQNGKFNEDVLDYYSKTQLDASGMRLKMKRSGGDRYGKGRRPRRGGKPGGRPSGKPKRKGRKK